MIVPTAILVAALGWLAAEGPVAQASVPRPPSESVRALLGQDHWREALVEARRIAAAAPSDPAANSALGEALFRAGRLDEAEGVLAPLCDGDAPPARALLTLGLLRRAAGDTAAGSTLVERALRGDPADRRILYWAASFASSSAVAAARLEEYLRSPEGEDPDRVEAARGFLELMRALGERATWVVESRPERVEVPLRPLGGRGSVTGWVIDASLGDGAPVPLLLDSGADGLFLLQRVAKKHKFAPLASETAFGGGGDERHATKRGIFPTFAIGALRFRDALASVSSVEVEPTGQYRGILGLDVFDGYRITLDLARGRMILDSSPGGESGERYWSLSGQLLVKAGARSGPAGLFLFDTGASTSLVDLAYASACPGAEVTDTARIRGYGGAVRGARTVRGLRLGFAGAESPLDRVGAIDLSLRNRLGGVEVSGFLGLDLWNGGRVVIDTVGRRIRLEPPGAGGGSRTLTPARSGGF